MGRYGIKRRVVQLAYELELLSHKQIHPIISCAHLEPYEADPFDRPPSEPSPIIVNGQKRWVVGELIEAKGKGSQRLIGVR